MALFSVEIDQHRAIARLEALPEDLRARLVPVVGALQKRLLGKARAAAPSRTGAYRASIRGDVDADKGSVIGAVSAGGGDQYYARFVEYGAEVPAHAIMPKSVKALKFGMLSAGQVYAKRVMHPGAHIDKQNILHGALDSMKGEIESGLRQAIETVAEKD